MDLAAFSGPTCDDIDHRIDRITELWARDIPDGWRREDDARLIGRRRYSRNHASGAPKKDTEHEIEHDILGGGPGPIPKGRCLGNEIVDGVNAIPLARDARGRRAGNVEADLLLLTRSEDTFRQFLLEVKFTSNDAWYAVVENLRQLRLFRESPSAREIFRLRASERSLPDPLPMTAGVLAPKDFYDHPGKKRNSTGYARKLIAAMSGVVEDVPLELCVWAGGEISRLP